MKARKNVGYNDESIQLSQILGNEVLKQCASVAENAESRMELEIQ